MDQFAQSSAEHVCAVLCVTVAKKVGEHVHQISSVTETAITNDETPHVCVFEGLGRLRRPTQVKPC